MKKIVILFLTFLKIGTFTFGGGYAMISLIKNEFVSKKEWISDDMFFDIVAIAESTPGPLAINSATYIGYHVAGFLGAIVSTIAVCIPSFTIIYVISSFFENFLQFSYVRYALDGIQSCVVYLILISGIQMISGIQKTFFNCAIVTIVLLSMLTFSVLSINFSTAFYIIICGILGITGYFIKLIRSNKK